MLKHIIVFAVFATSPAFAEDRVVGGEEVEPNSLPFAVSVQSEYGFHFCGGSLLDQITVLTAGHCCDLQTTEDILIAAGAHNVLIDEETQQISGVSSIVIHESFNAFAFLNDVCLLKLNTTLEFNDAVSAISLPSSASQPGDKATVAGWGATETGGLPSEVLMAAEITVISDEECSDDYGPGFIFNDQMICAADEGKDACQADSGGPLFLPDSIEQVGIVSWGFECADANHPGVYAEVFQYVDWIEANRG